MPAAIIVRTGELGGHKAVLNTLETKRVLCLPRTEPRLFGVISGFYRDVDEVSSLLGRYAVWSGNSLQTFREKLSGPSSTVNYAA